MSTTKSIEGLLEKPVYMMTGEEYLELTHYALANSPNAVLREAIVSRIGRRIVFDVDKARKLADGYQSTKK